MFQLPRQFGQRVAKQGKLADTSLSKRIVAGLVRPELTQPGKYSVKGLPQPPGQSKANDDTNGQVAG